MTAPMTAFGGDGGDTTSFQPARRRIGALGGGSGGAFGQPATQSFSDTSNLIGTQINPTDSRNTRTAQGAANASQSQYNNYQLSPFQGVTPLDLSGQQGQLAGANAQMQGNSYNFNPANAQYGTAQSQQATAMQGAQGFMGQAATMAGQSTRPTKPLRLTTWPE